jgi:hypothetical protein
VIEVNDLPIDVVNRHVLRFSQVANRYPRRVAEAYGGDLERAAADSDQQVAATVAAWERVNRSTVRDWSSIGADDEGRELGGQG